MNETRQEQAQRLVDQGDVSTYPDWHQRQHILTHAEVEVGERIYLVTIYRNGTFLCTCDWGDHHSYTDNLCTHALAVRLAVEKEMGGTGT